MKFTMNDFMKILGPTDADNPNYRITWFDFTNDPHYATILASHANAIMLERVKEELEPQPKTNPQRPI